MKTVIVGMGTVGKCLHKFLSQLFECVGVDKGDTIPEADMYFVCIPTTHETTCLNAVLKDIQKVAKSDSMVVIESTIPLGTFEQIKSWFPLDIGYSPERISPHDMESYDETKLVSGDHRVVDLLMGIYPTPVSCTPAEAEITKLYENFFRYMQITVANDMAILAADYGVDPERIAALASTKWNIPHIKPGLIDGECLPYAQEEWGTYLARKAYRSNEGYFDHVLLKLAKHKVVTFNGMGYKPGATKPGDERKRLMEALERRGTEVRVTPYDPSKPDFIVE